MKDKGSVGGSRLGAARRIGTGPRGSPAGRKTSGPPACSARELAPRPRDGAAAPPRGPAPGRFRVTPVLEGGRPAGAIPPGDTPDHQVARHAAGLMRRRRRRRTPLDPRRGDRATTDEIEGCEHLDVDEAHVFLACVDRGGLEVDVWTPSESLPTEDVRPRPDRPGRRRSRWSACPGR
jgi:hypothetical protein